MARRIIQIIIGLVLAIIGIPSKESIVATFAKELLCDPGINQCALGITISTLVFIIGLVAIGEALFELFGEMS